MKTLAVGRGDTPDWLDRGGLNDGGGISTESGVPGPGMGTGEACEWRRMRGG